MTAGFFFFAWGYHLVAGPLNEAPNRAAHLLTGFMYGAVGMTALSCLRMREDVASFAATVTTCVVRMREAVPVG